MPGVRKYEKDTKNGMPEGISIREARYMQTTLYSSIARRTNNPPAGKGAPPMAKTPEMATLGNQVKRLQEEINVIRESTIPQIQGDIRSMVEDLAETKEKIKNFDTRFDKLEGAQADLAIQQESRFDRLEQLMNNLCGGLNRQTTRSTPHQTNQRQMTTPMDHPRNPNTLRTPNHESQLLSPIAYNVKFCTYHTLKKDLPNRMGGGVAILVHKSLQIKCANNKTITFTSAYIPQGDCEVEDVEVPTRTHSIDPTTGKESTLDLTITPPEIANTAKITLGPHLCSDRLPITIIINATLNRSSERPPGWRSDQRKWTEWKKNLDATSQQKKKTPRKRGSPNQQTPNQRDHGLYHGTIGSRDQQKMWSFVNCMLGKGINLSPDTTEIRNNEVPIDNPKEKAELFLKIFRKSYNTGVQHKNLCEELINTRMATNIPNTLNDRITSEELERALPKSKSKAMGPDLIHNEMIRNLSSPNKLHLLHLFNGLLTNAHVPKLWKQSIVIPLLKPGKPRENPTSYRPVSLTSCLSKTMERIIANRLHWLLETKGKINKIQAGLRRGCSTMDHIIQLETNIVTSFSQKKSTVAVFLDIKKAYDSIWIQGLFKMASMGITGAILAWLKNFVTGRSMCVRIGDQESSRKTISNGVPQGEVISPILFNIMMNDKNEPKKYKISYSSNQNNIKIKNPRPIGQTNSTQQNQQP
ncbi:putative R-directed D polymerase from mobile element jockey-like [Daphnia sinensis]|uniref:R-directed D polymerase from mobile element jockey-like n=1 Tax=Daphnia sinensis TaxID=1820382 RepID=A0AAD5PZ90_9CRUS|nr:putative R-directed D polymerase from mobile element jockey-like [Daphnia sinensis]